MTTEPAEREYRSAKHRADRQRAPGRLQAKRLLCSR